MQEGDVVMVEDVVVLEGVAVEEDVVVLEEGVAVEEDVMEEEEEEVVDMIREDLIGTIRIIVSIVVLLQIIIIRLLS